MEGEKRRVKSITEGNSNNLSERWTDRLIVRQAASLTGKARGSTEKRREKKEGIGCIETGDGMQSGRGEREEGRERGRGKG